MARRRLTLRQKFRKWLNRALENSFATQFGVLVFLTLAIMAAGTLLALLLPTFDKLIDAAWWTWNRVTNPGMLPEDAGEGAWQIALSSIVILCGWIVFGLLISILTTAFQERLESIKRGTTEVLATEHTIVLGWNSTVFSVIDQLGSDDEGLVGEVVVLSDREVDTMKEEAAKYCSPESLRRVEFRRGSIASVKNVQDIKIADARQVIILGPDVPGEDASAEGDAATGDSGVLKALLACYQTVAAEKHFGDGRRLPIVASVRSAGSARIIQRGVPDSVDEKLVLSVIQTADLLSRLTAQSANQPELSLVYKELFSYRGSIVGGEDISSEIYCVPIEEPTEGLTFGEALFGYDRAIPIGYTTPVGAAINPKPGSPQAEYRFRKGDRIVAVADKREDVRWTGRKGLPKQEFTPRDLKPVPRNVLVMGDGLKSRKILEHLPGFLPPDSRIAAVQSTDGIDPGASSFHRFTHPGVFSGTESVTASVEETGEPSDEPSRSPRLGEFDSIVLTDDTVDPDRHDAKMLMDLTAVYATAGGRLRASIIVELLDYRNLQLAKAFGDMAAIISSELVSNFLVQLAVDPERGEVYTELLDPTGNEIYVRPVDRFLSGGERDLTFDDISARARSLGEIAIGYIPPPPEPLRLCPHDRAARKSPPEYGKIVVVAED